jgi:hypothetical protein
MKKTKLITLLTVFAFILLIGNVFSQDNNQKEDNKQEVKTPKMTPEEQATKITDKLNKHLNLTSEQYTKIKKLYTDNITYKRELKDKDLISKSEVKAKQKEFREGIKSTLTDEQKEKMKKMMKKKHGKHKKHGF